jgi:hypothetical protein
MLDEVSSVDGLKVHRVNAIAPFVTNGCLRDLRRRTPGGKHIVNVSAVARAVLPSLQDDQIPVYQYGQGDPEHDDADVGGRLPR